MTDTEILTKHIFEKMQNLSYDKLRIVYTLVGELDKSITGDTAE